MTVNGIPVYEAKADLFKSLGHPVRIRVLELLTEREHAVHELLERIEVEQTGLSQHLAVLRRTGLVRQQRVGGQVVYSLVGAEAARLLASARRLLRELVDEGRSLGESLDGDGSGDR
jgi:ArsR family transcriptional regulator